MTALRPVALCALVVMSGPATAQDPPASDLLEMGAYVATDDLAGSRAFYAVVFGRPPALALPNFVAFDVGGGWFVLASRARYASGAKAGTGVVPYIRSNDLTLVKDRIEHATGRPAQEIIAEPGIEILKVKDPNDQLVEFFRLTGE